jgi:mercuric ion transport protein
MGTRSSHLLSGLGVTAAVAAFVGASCCVLPLLLAWAGLAGAWLIYLEPFVVYRRALVLLAIVVIAAGWWLALRRRASWGTLVVLASASALTLGAVVVTEYEGPLQRYVLSLKRG